MNDKQLDLYAQLDDLVYSYAPRWVNRVWRKLTRRFDTLWTARLHREFARAESMAAHPSAYRV